MENNETVEVKSIESFDLMLKEIYSLSQEYREKLFRLFVNRMDEFIIVSVDFRDKEDSVYDNRLFEVSFEYKDNLEELELRNSRRAYQAEYVIEHFNYLNANQD